MRTKEKAKLIEKLKLEYVNLLMEIKALNYPKGKWYNDTVFYVYERLDKAIKLRLLKDQINIVRAQKQELKGSSYQIIGINKRS